MVTLPMHLSSDSSQIHERTDQNACRFQLIICNIYIDQLEMRSKIFKTKGGVAEWFQYKF